jgi:hypothetical protein
MASRRLAGTALRASSGWAALAAVLAVGIGCEIPATTAEGEAEAAAAVAAASTASASATSISSTSGSTSDSAAAATAEQAEWDSITWQGESAAGATKAMTLSASVTGNREFVNFTWDQYPFGGTGLGHFFVWTGTGWKGGKFDWIRAPGQSTKLTENIRGGYNGLSEPASGTAVAFAWTSADGKQRSNLAKTTWP